MDIAHTSAVDREHAKNYLRVIDMERDIDLGALESQTDLNFLDYDMSIERHIDLR